VVLGALRLRVVEHGFDGLAVGVQVGQDRGLHPRGGSANAAERLLRLDQRRHERDTMAHRAVGADESDRHA
jgi:hypothetical protein